MSMFIEIHDKRQFDSVWEYEQMERNLASLLKAGSIVEVPVKTPLSQTDYEEHWYQDKETGEIYRYVPPEFPARGVWEKV
jgi:hypothetical protein